MRFLPTLALLAVASPALALEPKDVWLVVNKNVPESRQAADHYIAKRGVPKGNVVELDLLAQRRVSQDRYERWRGGRLVEQELEILAVRCWGLREFELTLKEAGFTDISVCGDWKFGRPLRPSDREWCFQAVKPS